MDTRDFGVEGDCDGDFFDWGLCGCSVSCSPIVATNASSLGWLKRACIARRRYPVRASENDDEIRKNERGHNQTW